MRRNLLKVGIGIIIGVIILIAGVVGVGKDSGIKSLKDSIDKSSDIKSVTSDVYFSFKEDDKAVFEANVLLKFDKEIKKVSGDLIFHTINESDYYNLLGDVNGIIIKEDIENGKEYKIAENSKGRIKRYLVLYKSYEKYKKNKILNEVINLIISNFKGMVTQECLEDGTKRISILIDERKLNNKILKKLPYKLNSRKEKVKKLFQDKFLKSINEINKGKFEISILKKDIKIENIEVSYIVDNESRVKSCEAFLEVKGLDKDNREHTQSIKIESDFTDIDTTKVNEKIFKE